MTKASMGRESRSFSDIGYFGTVPSIFLNNGTKVVTTFFRITLMIGIVQ
jgi:hypothetical protein